MLFRSHARQALDAGSSYTPPLAPSAPVAPALPAVAQPSPPATLPAPHFVPHPVASPIVQVAQPVFPPEIMVTPAPSAPNPSPPTTVAANPQAVANYTKQIGDLFSQWSGRAPETDVVLPPPAPSNGSSGNEVQPASTAAGTGTGRPAATPVASVAKDPGTILIPAGRGIYAHPILALSSDQSSPVVMQADSGPIAGDRMIGSFERQNKRLVIHIASIVHQGQTIGCDGVVVAPDTMEAAVASGVDEHYLSRFILPAAAAFVQGLGQAIATTSNTTAVLSPFGGATTSTNLNFHQQLGVAAGAAAGQIGTVLNQEAPKGPTISLDANVGVGVMFLSDVKQTPPQ